MKVKRQKQHRRHVRFYKVCFGFREPFKVLCDGNFVHQVVKDQLGDLHQLLPKILGGSVKPMITRCVMAELRKLGAAFSGTVEAARQLTMARCEHEPVLTAAECVRAMVGTTNPEHLWVASQDADLRRHIRKVPGGALMYANRTTLVLEPPSEDQQRLAKLSEAERLRLTEREENLLKSPGAMKRLAEGRRGGGVEERNGQGRGGGEGEGLEVGEGEDNGNDGSGFKSREAGGGSRGLEGEEEDDEGRRHRRGAKSYTEMDRPVFKRKHVKGPNPLSVKKKKPKAAAQPATGQKMQEGEVGTNPVRKRKRVRAKKGVKEGSSQGGMEAN